MPLLETTVDFTNHFAEITRELEHKAQRAVQMAAEEGAIAASARAASRSQSGQMAAIRIEPVRQTHDGYIASFVSPATHAWFQNYGTLGNRRKKLKQSPRTDRTREPGTGIEPLRFLDVGKRAGVAAMKRVIFDGR